MQGCGTKGIFSFAKENIPFGTPRERRLDWQSRTRMTLMPPECRCLRGSIASLAANGSARRFASASIIRCRSAHLVEVRSNLRLPRHYSMRRAPAMPPWQAKANLLKSVIDGDCVRLPNRRQSDSEDRSKPSRIAMPLGRHPIRQAPQLFKLLAWNVETFLLGDLKGAGLYCERE